MCVCMYYIIASLKHFMYIISKRDWFTMESLHVLLNVPGE